jgi:hypothetical protein
MSISENISFEIWQLWLFDFVHKNLLNELHWVFFFGLPNLVKIHPRQKKGFLQLVLVLTRAT